MAEVAAITGASADIGRATAPVDQRASQMDRRNDGADAR
jgi:NADP-dependent 3-hydroxy acid dehydrogenase YdfG